MSLPKHPFGYLKQVKEYLVKTPADQFGLCIDTGHVLRSDEDPVEWIKTGGKRIFGLHIKDKMEK